MYKDEIIRKIMSRSIEQRAYICKKLIQTYYDYGKRRYSNSDQAYVDLQLTFAVICKAGNGITSTACSFYNATMPADGMTYKVGLLDCYGKLSYNQFYSMCNKYGDWDDQLELALDVLNDDDMFVNLLLIMLFVASSDDVIRDSEYRVIQKYINMAEEKYPGLNFERNVINELSR